MRGLGATTEPELADRFPVMAEMLRTNYPYSADVLLDTGLTRHLDGLAARLAPDSHR